VLRTRPSGAGVNIPTTTVTPAAAATSRTRVAQGPSNGSATGPSFTPKQHMVASGNTTSRAPAAAAARTRSASSSRFRPGSSVDAIWASAICTLPPVPVRCGLPAR
jgi:hypothetical protein